MARRASLLGLVALACAALAGSAHGAPAVNGIYTVSGTPSKLTEGADGNVWVVVGGDTLARFSPTGVKEEFPLAGVTGAKGITSGPDGNLWLTATSAIVKVPPANPAGLTSFTVNDVIAPQGIVTGPDGNLWTGSADKVLKIKLSDPANPTLFTLTSTASPSARGIARAGALLWVVDFGGSIVSLTTAGVQTPHSVGGLPQDVGGSPGGQVLYGNPGTDPQTVGRIVPGGLPQTTSRPTGSDPFGVTFGQDGAFWAAEFGAGDLARVTTDGVLTTLGGLPKNDPRELATGPGNTLWVSLEQSKQVARVTGVEPPAVPPVTPPPGTAVPVGGLVPADTTAPAISGLRISPSRFRRGAGGLARIAAATPAAKVSLTLSEAARVTFSAQRLTSGRRVGGKCVAATRRNRARAGCTRAIAAGGAVSLSLPAGRSTLGFSGRLARALAPGGHRLLAVARDGAGNASAAARAGFTIRPPKRR